MKRRFRVRYMAIHIHENINRDMFGTIFMDTLKHLYGEIGLGTIWLKVIEYYEKLNIAIIRVDHKHVDHVRLAISLFSYSGDKIQAHVIKVSGTIRALHKSLKIKQENLVS
ncbi:MAG: Rpp14/Pop5 family protein [Thermoprotei archaeon]|jgi:RNase P/RNase MRP subunit POP5